MTDAWGEGIGTTAGETVFDLAVASPRVFAAVHEASPRLDATLGRLRAGIPVMSSAAVGVQGQLYRLKFHNRSTCVALGAEVTTSDVIVLKGSEPLLPDFARYLDWMKSRQFGTWPRPIMEHFPLVEGKAPGTVFLDEALREAELSLAVQNAHLAHYGELLRLPVPLLVFRLPEARRVEVTEALRTRMSAQAFERVEAHLARGLGVFAYYYPGPPVRVHAVGKRTCFLPGQEPLGMRERVIDTMAPRWISMAARLLWLGYLPATPLSWRLGTVFEVNNACLDGGACDIGSVLPMADAPNDGFFARSVIMGVGSLRTVIARAFGVPMPDLAQTFEQDVLSFYLGDYVRSRMDQALTTESRDTLTLDPRVRPAFAGGKSLPEIAEMFRVINSYLETSDYR